MKKQTLNHQMITSQLSEFSSKEFLGVKIGTSMILCFYWQKGLIFQRKA
jgi:hypothetical protein